MNRPVHPRFLAFALLVLLSCPAALAAPDPSGRGPLMRYPDIHGNQVVFVLGGDIFTVPAQGGRAVRLTFHEGDERYPKISPDGKWIAFTGEYDGNADVYVMPAEGGPVKRLTYHPGGDEVIGWHPANGKILFRSGRVHWNGAYQLFLIDPAGKGLERLPLHEAGWGRFSPDGKQIVYTRVATEDRTWKRYRGGLAPELYLYDFSSAKDRKLTDFPGTDAFPLWFGGAIYFNSDRDGVLNLFQLDPATGSVQQITHHRDYDARRPSGDGTTIVYELGGTLQLLDVSTGNQRSLPVTVEAELPETRPYFKNVRDFITGIDVAPGGERALVVARGELFNVPKKEGVIRNLTRDPGANDRGAVWSPDGKWIAYLSDKAGEYDIFLADPTGDQPSQQLTHFSAGFRHNLRWSPDSRKLSFTDQTLQLFYIDIDTKKVTLVDRAEFEPMDVSLERKPISDAAWSPDSRFLAYSKMESDLVSRLFVYPLEEGKPVQVSTGIVNDFGPVFSRDGEHLFFISNRTFVPTYCDFEFEMVYKKVAGIYSLTLRRDGPALLPPVVDGPLSPVPPSGKPEDKASLTVRIDLAGLYDRIEALPLPAGNYRQLAPGKDGLFYLDADEGDFNRFEFRDLPQRTLSFFRFEDKKTRKVIADIDDYRLSANGTHLAYVQGSDVGILEASAENSPGSPCLLQDLTMFLDPPAEWKQIFREAWRMERDFYYDPNMHGLNWKAVGEKYGALIERASSRQDVGILIGEMIGELNTSHTYVYGGDRRRRSETVSVGMLGADLEIDPAAGRYRFTKIFRTPDWTEKVIPPLGGPGIDVREGDYLLSVDGVEVTADREVYAFFQNLAGKPVKIVVNEKPVAQGARQATVVPRGGEFALRYQDWIEHNRQVVEKESGGKIGYLHLPDTFTGAAREFGRFFYGQTQKEGLVIDGRFNGGGLDPDIFLRRLSSPTLYYWTRRYSHDQTTPAVVTRAHLALLTNRQAGSGGDMLPGEFQLRKLGPVIGTRSWGGLVGVSMFITLIDGGQVTTPDYRIYLPDGRWTIENQGVQPDIEIDLDPAEMARGYDAQLMKAVDYLLKKIAAEPRPWPNHEPFPVDAAAPNKKP